jgi:hypothetical protein
MYVPVKLLKESAPLPHIQVDRELKRLQDELLASLATSLSTSSLVSYQQDLLSFAIATRVSFQYLLHVFCGAVRVPEPLDKQAKPYHRERVTWLPCTW